MKGILDPSSIVRVDGKDLETRTNAYPEPIQSLRPSKEDDRLTRLLGLPIHSCQVINVIKALYGSTPGTHKAPNDARLGIKSVGGYASLITVPTYPSSILKKAVPWHVFSRSAKL